ncbi:MAG TPA: histidine kinase dimerization/phospho-acceptor domain-containing protein, partial [Terriglobales bacterium]|nr:histidine kinase dimerization/phospho-acceptor domain-containing protein [Terriglobales bacterium]
DRVLATLKEAVDTAKRYEIEFRIVVSDGSLRWIASSGEFYKTLKGQGRMIGINVDITRRKLAEKALEAAAREEMAGELAHKINNPLQGLLHALYLLHQQSREVEVQRYAVAAQSEAERVARLVKELLRLYSEPPRAA